MVDTAVEEEDPQVMPLEAHQVQDVPVIKRRIKYLKTNGKILKRTSLVLQTAFSKKSLTILCFYNYIC